MASLKVPHLAVFSKLSKAFIDTPFSDHSVVFSLMTRSIGEFLGDLCVICLVSEDKQWLSPIACYHPEANILALAQKVLQSNPCRSDEGLAGRALKENQTIFIPDIDPQKFLEWIKPEQRWDIKQAGVHGAIVVPMKQQRESLGVLCVLRTRADNPYTQEDQAFLESAANLAVLAAKNSGLAGKQSFKARQDIQKIRSQFIAAASHALRNPLTIVKSAVEDLKDGAAGELTAQQARYLDIASRGVTRLTKEVENILHLEQLEKSTARFQRNRVDLAALIFRHVEKIRPSALEKKLELKKKIPESLPPCFADADLAGLLLNNLLDNALKFAKSQIHIEAAATLEGVQIGVFNDTAPFSQNHLQDILQKSVPAQMLDYRSGIGLGLILCKGIVDLHKGKIWAETTPDGWSKFYVLFPRAAKKK